MMKNLVATKPFSYQTRRLRPGDPFQASDRDARLLIAINKAAEPRQPGVIEPPPPALAAKIANFDPLDHDHDGRRGGSRNPIGDLRALRKKYVDVVGKRPFNGWGADELQAKIAAAGK